MPDVPRLRRPFRFGIVRGVSRDFKPIVTIGLSKDGGLMVIPVPVKQDTWTYGRVRPHEAPRPGEHIVTSSRPKLHYHRSGIAAVTLTGADLERRTVRLTPLQDIEQEPIISVVATRPWELASTAVDRTGDTSTLERKWPQTIGLTLSVLALREDDESNLELTDIAPMGLVPGDRRTFVVDLSSYGRRAVLAGRFRLCDDPWRETVPSITVSALPGPVHQGISTEEGLALWSSSLSNPIINWTDSADIIAPETLVGVPGGRVNTYSSIEERLAVRAQRDGVEAVPGYIRLALAPRP